MNGYFTPKWSGPHKNFCASRYRGGKCTCEAIPTTSYDEMIRALQFVVRADRENVGARRGPALESATTVARKALHDFESRRKLREEVS